MPSDACRNIECSLLAGVQAPSFIKRRNSLQRHESRDRTLARAPMSRALLTSSLPSYRSMMRRVVRRSLARSLCTSIRGTPYAELSIGVPKETAALERRVSQTPETVGKLVKEGFTVRVESGAGAAASFSDSAYAEAGAQLTDRAGAFSASLVTKVTVPTPEEAKLVGDRMLLSFIFPAQNPELLEQLQAQKATVFAMDCIPRTLSRGQAFDALSSQANIAGYRAVVEAANEFGRFFAGQMTAAGKVHTPLPHPPRLPLLPRLLPPHTAPHRRLGRRLVTRRARGGRCRLPRCW